MKSNEIRNLSVDEIHDEVASRRQKLQELRFTAAIGQNSNVREIRAKRREIAQLLTIVREKEEAR
ncbi:MAG: 50S ribosomal protein L29 [Trueperaceae bacterium]|nr:50S ribosomal protein L29 [Trueperaceae bacterium]